MLKKNNIVLGLVAGMILPGVAWLVFGFLLKNKAAVFNKPAIPYLVAIAVNLFIIKYLFRKGDDQTGMGVILSTFVAMIITFLIQAGYLG